MTTDLAAVGLAAARLGLVGLAALTLGAFFSRTGWLFELADHLRPLAAAALVALAVLFLLAGRLPEAIISVVLFLIHGFVLLPHVQRKRSGQRLRGHRAVFANVLTANQRREDVLDFVVHNRPDVVALVEINDRWLKGLAPLAERLPYAASFPSDENNRGMALFSRLPILEAGLQDFGDLERPCLVAHVQGEGAPLGIVLAHPLPPKRPGMARLRDLQLDAIAAYLRGRPGRWLVVGDLNLTPWSPIFQSFLWRAGLEDGRRGFGLQPTWPAPIPLFPIDHVLGAGLSITGFSVGPQIGSDHRPVLFRFETQNRSDIVADG